MTKYQQGTKGTTLLTIAGISNLVLSLFQVGLMFFTMVGAGFASRRLTDTLARMLIINRESLAGFGLRNIALIVLIILFLSLVVTLFMAITTLYYRRRDDGRTFLAISSGILLAISVVFFVFTWSWIFVVTALIWLCTFVGALLSKFPGNTDRLEANLDAMAKAAQYDTGRHRPGSGF